MGEMGEVLVTVRCPKRLANFVVGGRVIQHANDGQFHLLIKLVFGDKVLFACLGIKLLATEQLSREPEI